MKALWSLLLAAGLSMTALPAAAQAAATPSKKELVAKVLELTQPGIEQVARSLVEQPAAQMLQAAGRVVGQRVPEAKREAVAAEIKADVQKYLDETIPLLRDRAIKLAPSTLGATLEEKFTAEELQQFVAWLESPVNKKYQQLAPQMQGQFAQKLVAETRGLVEPKLKALDATISKRLGLTPARAASAPAAAASR